MVKNFEEITEDLPERHKLLIPYLERELILTGKDSPLKAPKLVRLMKKHDKTFTQVMLRKMVNYLRKSAVIPIIATSKGYYVSYDKEDIENQIQSLQERASSIHDSANGLNQILKTIK